MYSSWYKPEGEESTILTDHEALHRDAATHRSIQSNEKQLRPLDLETIMSSKAAVKYWYLHRPQTMAYVHQNAVKIQSVGRSYAVRKLKNKHGVEYTVQLAKSDAEKKHTERLAEMTAEEIALEEEEHRKLEERRQQYKAMKREILAMEQEDELSKAENAMWLVAYEAEQKRVAQEKLDEEKRLLEEQQAAEAERMREEEENERMLEQERVAAEVASQQALLKAAELSNRAAADAEAARVARVDAELEAQREAAYDNSYGRGIPVTTPFGAAKIASYDRNKMQYRVTLQDGVEQVVAPDDIQIDEARVLSPRTKVDTPFGLGEVVGLDVQVGCYAINAEAIHSDEGTAYVQVDDVLVHVEEDEPAVVLNTGSTEELERPEEIVMKSASIVDTRVVSRKGKRFVQYKLQVETTNYGTVYCWKRYSTFRMLRERLIKEKGFTKKEIPDLPHRSILGNFSQKTISDRASKLNAFLHAAVEAEYLQWGIKIDDDIAVFKRRNKNAPRPTTKRRSTLFR